MLALTLPPVASAASGRRASARATERDSQRRALEIRDALACEGRRQGTRGRPGEHGGAWRAWPLGVAAPKNQHRRAPPLPVRSPPSLPGRPTRRFARSQRRSIRGSSLRWDSRASCRDSGAMCACGAARAPRNTGPQRQPPAGESWKRLPLVESAVSTPLCVLCRAWSAHINRKFFPATKTNLLHTTTYLISTHTHTHDTLTHTHHSEALITVSTHSALGTLHSAPSALAVHVTCHNVFYNITVCECTAVSRIERLYPCNVSSRQRPRPSRRAR